MTRKETSNAKAATNRQNAKKSTGPKTEQGKAVVSKNAVQHGILSTKMVVVPGHESAEEFQQLQTSLTQYFQPLGSLEELCVELIGTLYWRLRRVIAFEHGSILANLSSADLKRELDREQDWIEASEEHYPYGTTTNAKRKALNTTAHGLRILSTSINQIIESLKKDEELDPYLFDEINDRIGRYHFDKGKGVVNMSRLASKSEEERKWVANHYRETLLEKGLIDKDCQDIERMARLGLIEAWEYVKEAVQERREEIEESDETGDRAARLAASLPAPDDVQKICRYEAHLFRHLKQTLETLSGLQGARLGVEKAPTFNFNVDNVNLTQDLPNKAN